MAMRRASRQIEVFDISLMAVVTKAMGAFLVLMILLMPYYRSNPTYQAPVKDLSNELNDLQKQLEQMKQRLGTSTEDPAELRRQLDAARQELGQAQDALTKLSKQLDQAWSQYQQADARSKQLQSQLASAQQRLADAQSQAQQATQTANTLGKTLEESEPQIRMVLSVLYHLPASCSDAVYLDYDFDILHESAGASQTVRDAAPGYAARVGTAYSATTAPIALTPEGDAAVRQFVVRTNQDHRFYIYAQRRPGQTIAPDCRLGFSVSLMPTKPPTTTFNPQAVLLKDDPVTLLRVVDLSANPVTSAVPTDDDLKELGGVLVKRDAMAAEAKKKQAGASPQAAGQPAPVTPAPAVPIPAAPIPAPPLPAPSPPPAPAPVVQPPPAPQPTALPTPPAPQPIVPATGSSPAAPTGNVPSPHPVAMPHPRAAPSAPPPQ